MRMIFCFAFSCLTIFQKTGLQSRGADVSPVRAICSTIKELSRSATLPTNDTPHQHHPHGRTRNTTVVDLSGTAKQARSQQKKRPFLRATSW